MSNSTHALPPRITFDDNADNDDNDDNAESHMDKMDRHSLA